VCIQLAAACLGMGDPNAEYRPPITFVVVQKRHHTRLFPGRPNEGDRSGNILPGELLCTAQLHYINNMQSLCWFFCGVLFTVMSFVAICAADIRCYGMSDVMCVTCCCQPSFAWPPLKQTTTYRRDVCCGVSAGTLIDRDICHPTEFDFYLNSHAGIQGTNRPCHYHVLLDENKFGAQELALMTFRCGCVCVHTSCFCGLFKSLLCMMFQNRHFTVHMVPVHLAHGYISSLHALEGCDGHIANRLLP